jgi:hypothetical protein
MNGTFNIRYFLALAMRCFCGKSEMSRSQLVFSLTGLCNHKSSTFLWFESVTPPNWIFCTCRNELCASQPNLYYGNLVVAQPKCSLPVERITYFFKNGVFLFVALCSEMLALKLKSTDSYLLDQRRRVLLAAAKFLRQTFKLNWKVINQ